MTGLIVINMEVMLFTRSKFSNNQLGVDKHDKRNEILIEKNVRRKINKKLDTIYLRLKDYHMPLAGRTQTP